MTNKASLANAISALAAAIGNMLASPATIIHQPVNEPFALNNPFNLLTRSGAVAYKSIPNSSARRRDEILPILCSFYMSLGK